MRDLLAAARAAAAEPGSIGRRWCRAYAAAYRAARDWPLGPVIMPHLLPLERLRF